MTQCVSVISCKKNDILPRNQKLHLLRHPAVLNELRSMLDKEIRRKQVQVIRNVDGLVALFADLGYRPDLRAIQTAETLAITTESAALTAISNSD